MGPPKPPCPTFREPQTLKPNVEPALVVVHTENVAAEDSSMDVDPKAQVDSKVVDPADGESASSMNAKALITGTKNYIEKPLPPAYTVPPWSAMPKTKGGSVQTQHSITPTITHG